MTLPGDGQPVDEDFAWFLEQFGAPTASQRVSSRTIAKFQGKLPDQLLEYWQRFGFCSFRMGLFSIVDPDEYEEDMETWIGDTDIVERDSYYVIARTSFGKLFLWGTHTGYMYNITPSLGWVYAEDRHSQKIKTEGADKYLRYFFSALTPESVDSKGNDRKLLHDRATAKLGQLGSDEVFAFEPSLMTGGEAKLENIEKRNVHIHLSVLSQLGHREVLDRAALTKKAFG